MAKIELSGVAKVFGPRPESVLPLVGQGMGKAEILEKTGHTVGLRDVSLDVDEGETFVVMGLSGSGKSTLLRLLNRLVEPTAGSVMVDGRDVLSLGRAELVEFRRHAASMVFQGFALLPHRTVLANVAYGLEAQGMERRARQAEAGAGGSRRSALAVTKRACRPSCRAACASASGWPGRWPPAPASCSWTSPSGRSTP